MENLYAFTCKCNFNHGRMYHIFVLKSVDVKTFPLSHLFVYILPAMDLSIFIFICCRTDFERKNFRMVFEKEDIWQKEYSRISKIRNLKRKDIKAVDIVDDSVIIEGLRRNDLVVVRGVNEIMNGQRVKIKTPETKNPANTDE